MVKILLLGLTFTLIFSSMLMTDIVLTWLIMEVTMLLFVCWAGITEYKSLTVEGLMLYFISQSYAGIFMIVTIFWNIYLESNMNFFCLVATVMLGIKIGLFPLHFWVIPTTLSLDYYSLIVMMTVMKVIPLQLGHEFMYLRGSPDQFPSSLTLWSLMAVLSLLMGTIYGLGATSFRHMLAASSIVHSGWLVLSMMSYSMWWYFLGYSLTIWLLLSSVYFQSWFRAGFYLLMLAGLPPFSMFVLKIYVLAKGILTGVYVELLTAAAVSAAISLFYYLKLAYSFMLKGLSTQPYMGVFMTFATSLACSVALSVLLILDLL
uniref:NADH-ubiquinone oxidoreductase chain 2 n=1 Tax=Cerion tridentatum costellata TaxID=1108932 RepID=A0A1W6Q5K4_9EUPU|nr:NADH dehydrogenase subunit 2 [Cerion tridentatum costellata]